MQIAGLDLKAVIVVLLLAYVSVAAVTYVFQRQLTYFPGKEAFFPASWSMTGFKEIIAAASDGTVFKSWHHSPLEADKPTIVFFQGNGGHLGYRNFKVMPWVEAGYGVLLTGYPGYNGNPGKASEEELYRAARASLNALLQRGTPEDRIVLYGESIGTGVAVQMAAEFHAKALILEAPFSSLPDAGAYHYPYLPVRWLMRDRFDSLSKIPSVKMPLLWIHGERDGIVPIKLGRRLFDAASGPKKALVVPEAGHNDLYEFDVQAEVLRFLAGLT